MGSREYIMEIENEVFVLLVIGEGMLWMNTKKLQTAAFCWILKSWPIGN